VRASLVSGGWCYACGREAQRVVELRLPCPWCASLVRIRLCEECARLLVKEIVEATNLGLG